MKWDQATEKATLRQAVDHPERHIVFDEKDYTARNRILIHVNYLTVSLHRYLFELVRFPLYDSYCLRTCDIAACVNPWHYRVSHAPRIYTTRKPRTTGTPTRGEQNSAKVECPRGHPYTPGNTYYYQRRDGHESRHCRTCQRERNRIRNEARKARRHGTQH